MSFCRIVDSRLVAATYLAVLALHARSVLAQAVPSRNDVTIVVPEAPTCPACGIRIVPELVVDDAATRALRGAPSAVAMDPHHRYWFLGADVPVLVDSSGRSVNPMLVDRDPKEIFRHPYDVTTVGDSIVVVDPIAKTALVISPELRLLRQLRFDIPVTQISVLKWPSEIIGAGTLATPESIGWPLHLISITNLDATLDSSFGPGDGQLKVGSAGRLAERIAIGAPSGFWSFRRASYELTQWDASIKPLVTLSRKPSWFPASGAEPGLGGRADPPAPFVSAVVVDSTGLLWVYSSVPAETWPSAWPPPRPGFAEISISSVKLDKLFRSVIEVIDPVTARVIVRSFVNGWIPLALPGRHAVTYSTDAEGKRQISIVRLAIDRGDTTHR